jgi:uncharacterized protein YndB with AHSA1/START domain
MTERTVTHATFVIERTYDASPARVFNAWADPAAKARWFTAPADWSKEPHQLDLRVGGGERMVGGPKDGPMHVFESRYYDIVPNERVVSAYEMYLGETRISVSVATLELKAAGAGTRMVYTEQGAFLDGFDNPAIREEGTRDLLEKLGQALEQQIV